MILRSFYSNHYFLFWWWSLSNRGQSHLWKLILILTPQLRCSPVADQWTHHHNHNNIAKNIIREPTNPNSEVNKKHRPTPSWNSSSSSSCWRYQCCCCLCCNMSSSSSACGSLALLSPQSAPLWKSLPNHCAAESLLQVDTYAKDTTTGCHMDADADGAQRNTQKQGMMEWRGAVLLNIIKFKSVRWVQGFHSLAPPQPVES